MLIWMSAVVYGGVPYEEDTLLEMADVVVEGEVRRDVGAVSASVTVVTPMDLIKVRLQVAAREAGPGKGLEEESQTRRAAAMARAVWRAEGPAGFYRGISAIWGRQIVYKGAVLGFYDVFLDRLEA